MGSRCWYLTESWGVHDERWVAALHEQGFGVTILSLERDGLSMEVVLERVQSDDAPILAGPLDTITAHLTPVLHRITGLSWGFDLHRMSDRGDDLEWLTALHALIVDSRATQSIASEAGVEPERIYVIPWGIDVELFTPEGPRANLHELGVPSNSDVVLSLRAHEPRYRVSDVIEAFAILIDTHPRAHLVIGNSGSQTTELRTLCEHLKLSGHVTFIGAQTESALPDLMRASRVYVSASEVDGSSVTLLQAMACGLPVAVTDIPGNREWVDGALAPVGHPKALAEAMAAALDQGRTSAGLASAQDAIQRVRQHADWSTNQALLGQALR